MYLRNKSILMMYLFYLFVEFLSHLFPQWRGFKMAYNKFWIKTVLNIKQVKTLEQSNVAFGWHSGSCTSWGCREHAIKHICDTQRASNTSREVMLPTLHLRLLPDLWFSLKVTKPKLYKLLQLCASPKSRLLRADIYRDQSYSMILDFIFSYHSFEKNI